MDSKAGEPRRSEVPGGISMITGAAIVAGNMIGTGIFTSLGFQLAGIRSEWAIVVLWVLGGVIAFCGALSYGELGAALPRSGGEYHLVGRVWHPLPGFLAGWISITAGFAAPVALAASAFGTYVANSLFDGDARVRTGGGIGIIVIATVVHLRNVRLSSRFQVAATTIKVILLLAVIVTAFSRAPAEPAGGRVGFDDPWVLLRPEFVVGLFFVSYSYSGWNAAAYVAGEMRDPRRDLPRALMWGTGAVTVLYVLVNLAFLRAAPVAELTGAPDVALVAARHLFGESGGAIAGVVIAVGLVSTLSAMMWTGPRVARTMGEDWPMLRSLARVNRSGVPVLASCCQAAVALALLIWGGFAPVLVSIEFLLSLSTMLAVGGVLWLRWREPALPRPFRAWGYPLTQVLFLAFTGYAVVRLASDAVQWRRAIPALILVTAGLVVYLMGARGGARGGTRSSSKPDPQPKRPAAR